MFCVLCATDSIRRVGPKMATKSRVTQQPKTPKARPSGTVRPPGDLEVAPRGPQDGAREGPRASQSGASETAVSDALFWSAHRVISGAAWGPFDPPRGALGAPRKLQEGLGRGPSGPRQRARVEHLKRPFPSAPPPASCKAPSASRKAPPKPGKITTNYLCHVHVCCPQVFFQVKAGSLCTHARSST